MPSVQSDIFQVTSRMTIGGDDEDVQSVMHFRQQSAPALTDAQVLADIGDMMDGIYTIVNPSIVDIQDYIDINVKNVTQNLLLGATAWPVLTIGGSTVDPTAFQVVALLLMRTATPRVVGRVNFGVFRENGLASSNWVAGVQSEVLTAGLALLTDNIEFNGTWRYVVFNREFKTVTLPVSEGITVAARSQRRRSRGIGS